MRGRAAAFLAALLATVAVEAGAQSRPAATVLPYAGGFRLDDRELAPFGVGIDSGLLVGIRAERPLGARWAVGGSYGYGPFSIGALDGAASIDGAAHLYYGTVAWSAWRGPLDVRLGAGVGGVTLTSELDVSFTNLLLGFGGDVAFPVADRIRIGRISGIPSSSAPPRSRDASRGVGKTRSSITSRSRRAWRSTSDRRVAIERRLPGPLSYPVHGRRSPHPGRS